jgi:carbon monoxide dehydrogenase subunit G
VTEKTKGVFKMAKLDYTIVINRPVEDVFEFMNNPENEKLYRSGIIELEKISDGPIGVGTTTREVSEFLGVKMETTSEVTEYEPNKVIATKATSGPIPFTFKTTFEPVAEGTEVTAEFEGEIGGFFKMAESMVIKMGMKQIEGDFAKLKNLLET